MTACTPTAKRLAAALPMLLAIGLGGCAGTPTEQAGQGEVYDPLEPANRKVFAFNEGVDEYALEPAADAWTFITPAPFRRGVGNFFDNLGYPGVVLNDLLQGKGETATRDTIRFLVNSTLGLGGFLDPASSMGLTQHDEDFGQTLGVWGADSGAFLMLPLLGPSNVRDVTRYPVGWYTDVLTYSSLDALATGGLTVLRIVNTRAQFDRAVSIRDEAALDPYSFTRSSYQQIRLNRIYDGNPPQQDDPYGDFFDDMPAEGGSDTPPPAADEGAPPAVP